MRALREDARQLASLLGSRADGRRAVVVLKQDAFLILALWRLRCGARKARVPLVGHLLRRLQTVLFGIELGNDIVLGKGVFFVHPIGTVVGGNARVGDRVRFMGSNTIGTAKDNGCPVIEEDVTLGAGARVLGPVRIGRGAVIGANAVVLSDVPAGCVAVGVPARVRRESRTPKGTIAEGGVGSRYTHGQIHGYVGADRAADPGESSSTLEGS